VTYSFHEHNKWRYPIEKLFLRWTLVISQNNCNLLSSRSQIIELFSAFYSIPLQFLFQTTRNFNSLHQSNLIRKGFAELFSAYWSYGWPCIATIWRPLCRRIINKKNAFRHMAYKNLTAVYKSFIGWEFFVAILCYQIHTRKLSQSKKI